LTRRWVVTKSYRNERKPIFAEAICEDNAIRHIRVGDEVYKIDADGYLTPTKKGQAPPDLKHFEEP
jgi:hypothetical protein